MADGEKTADPFAGFVNNDIAAEPISAKASVNNLVDPKKDVQQGAAADNDGSAPAEGPDATPPVQGPGEDDFLEEDDEDEDDELPNEEDEDESEDEDATEEEQEVDDKARKPNKKPAKRRISELTRKLREMERENIALKAAREENDRLRTKPEKDADPVKPVKPTIKIDISDLEVPDVEKFKYKELDPDYIAAVSKHNATIAYREQRELDRQEQAAGAEASKLADSWKTNILPGLEDASMPDFKKVVLEGAAKWPLSEDLGKEIIQSPQGAKIAYHLAKNVDEAVKVNEMSAVQRARWLGRMETKFETSAPAPKPDKKVGKQTNAPTPPKIKVDQQSKVDRPTSEMSFAEFEQKAMSEARAKR